MSVDTVLARVAELSAAPAPAAAAQAAPVTTQFSSLLRSALAEPDATASAGTPAAAPETPQTTAHPAGCCCCRRPAGLDATAARDTMARAEAQPGATPADVPYAAEIDAAAARYGVDPALVRSVIAQESGFDPGATSGAGAQGLMQLMPQTAAGLGVADPYDPAQSIDGGTRFLGSLLRQFGGDQALALAAYNAGPGSVERHGGIPPFAETQDYVQQVLARAESFKNTDQ